MVNYKVGSYIRLSRDESYSNSDSIDNQIKLTDYYCIENKLEVIDKYIDNGYSGTNFDRPAFQKLLNDIDGADLDVPLEIAPAMFYERYKKIMSNY